MRRMAGNPTELEQRAERAVRRGELLVALEHFEAYQRALAASPANELLRERLEELRGLSRPTAPADLAAAEKLEVAAPSKPPPAGRSARASDASFAPLQSASPPKGAVKMLQDLLNRIRSGRRTS